MIKVDPMSAVKYSDFVLDMLSELRLNGVVKISSVEKVAEAVTFFEKMREVSYKELSLNY